MGGWREEGETRPPVKSSYENLTGSLKQALWSPKKYPSLDQMHEPTDSCSFQSDDGALRVVWNLRIMSLCFPISASLEECPMTPLTSSAKSSAWGGWSPPGWPPTRMSHQDGGGGGRFKSTSYRGAQETLQVQGVVAGFTC